MKNKETIEELLNQIIQISEERNAVEKLKDPTLSGEDWMTFHLKRLKDLILLED